MKPTEEASPLQDDPPPGNIDFYVITTDFGCGEIKSSKNTGTLVDLTGAGMGMLTRVPLKPGNIVELGREGESRLGIVMWSVEDSTQFRVQVRFV